MTIFVNLHELPPGKSLYTLLIYVNSRRGESRG